MGWTKSKKDAAGQSVCISGRGDLDRAMIECKEELLPVWINAFLSTYPLESSGFVRINKDQFGNPVGFITRTSLDTLYDAAAGADTEPELVKHALFELIQMRAIQDMTPSQVLGPLCRLKSLVREKLLNPALAAVSKADTAANVKAKGQEAAGAGSKSTASADASLEKSDIVGMTEDFLQVEARIDSLVLLGLDIFDTRREKVFQMRVDEIKRSQSQVVRWAKLRKGEAVEAAVEALDASSQNCKSEG